MTKPFFLFVSLFLVITCIAQQPAPTSADLKKKQAEIQKEIDNLKKSLDETQKYKKVGLGQLALIQKKLRLRQQQVETVNQQINSIQANINQNWREIVKLRGELDTLKIQYEKSVVYAYKNRSNYDFINFIFSAASFNDALKRVAYLKSYRAYREQQAANIHNTQNLLQQKIEGLNVNKKERSIALQEQTKQRSILEEDKKEQDVVVQKLRSQEKEISKDLTAKRKQDQTLRNAINAAIRREIEAAKKRAAEELAAKKAAEAKKAAAEAAAGKKTETPTGTKENGTAATAATTPAKPKVTRPESILDDRPEARAMSESFEKNRGSLPWPMASGIVIMHFGIQSFGDRKLQIDNPGITIEAGVGTSVKAVFDGEVSAVMSVGPSEAVIIRHGKYFTSYGNLAGVSVSRGQQVKMGQVIGKLAEKEDNRGELEFLITNDLSRNLDPEKWLR